MTSEIFKPQSADLARPTQTIPATGVPAAGKLILAMLGCVKHGTLQLTLPDGTTLEYGENSSNRASTPVKLELKNWDLCHAVLKSGDIGLAETFIEHGWSTDNLPRLIALLIQNRDAIESLVYGTWWGSLLYRLKHVFNRNSRAGSRKNIHAHYDIGNDFYQLWLDPTMTYSSAIFSNGHIDSLQDGQQSKYRRILSELQIKPDERILEIGCGWGGFAEIAASEGHAKVTGLTLSSEQLQFARRRLDQAGIAEKVDLHLLDYRDSQGKFDAIASIEMFEAVGEKYWPDYFECIARNLKPQGRACIQTIVIADELFARYRKGTDFIQQYIFPGGMLPSPEIFRRYAGQHGLQVVNEFAFGQDYARTLQEWHSAFKEQLSLVRAQGFDERFLRTWEFYLGYCEGGFRAKSIDVVQFTLEKK